MAKRKTIQEKEIEKLTTNHLDSIGELIKSDILEFSKVRTSDLSESGNFRTRPFNVLTVSQNWYGKYNTPKGKPTPKNRNNIKDSVMLNSIKKNVPNGINIFVKDMIDLLKSPVTLKKK